MGARTGVLVLLSWAALAPGASAAPLKPTATPTISAVLGEYRPNLEDWEVVVEWNVDCPGGDTYAWTIELRGKPNGEFVTANGFSSVPGGRKVVLVPAGSRPFDVTPYIQARCFAEREVSSDYAESLGAPVTIPSRRAGETQDGAPGDTDGSGGAGGEQDGDGTTTGSPGSTGAAGLPPWCAKRIAGGPDDDVLVGTAAAEMLLGFAGDDRLRGRGGDDCLRGHAGDDRLRGGAGRDLLQGGAGADVLDAGAGRNRLAGGRGDDRLDAVNGRRDRVDCGPGTGDVALADQIDVVVGCERRTQAATGRASQAPLRAVRSA